MHIEYLGLDGKHLVASASATDHPLALALATENPETYRLARKPSVSLTRRLGRSRDSMPSCLLCLVHAGTVQESQQDDREQPSPSLSCTLTSHLSRPQACHVRIGCRSISHLEARMASVHERPRRRRYHTCVESGCCKNAGLHYATRLSGRRLSSFVSMQLGKTTFSSTKRSLVLPE